MYEQLRLKELRHAYSVQGWALLIYYGIMNVAVMIFMFVEIFAQAFSAGASGQELGVFSWCCRGSSDSTGLEEAEILF